MKGLCHCLRLFLAVHVLLFMFCHVHLFWFQSIPCLCFATPMCSPVLCVIFLFTPRRVRSSFAKSRAFQSLISLSVISRNCCLCYRFWKRISVCRRRPSEYTHLGPDFTTQKSRDACFPLVHLVCRCFCPTWQNTSFTGLEATESICLGFFFGKSSLFRNYSSFLTENKKSFLVKRVFS